MKHLKTNIVLLLLAAFTLTQSLYSQPRPPSDHGDNEDYSPRPAPIGSGLTILLVLGAAYGAGKVCHNRNKHTR